MLRFEDLVGFPLFHLLSWVRVYMRYWEPRPQGLTCFHEYFELGPSWVGGGLLAYCHYGNMSLYLVTIYEKRLSVFQVSISISSIFAYFCPDLMGVSDGESFLSRNNNNNKERHTPLPWGNSLAMNIPAYHEEHCCRPGLHAPLTAIIRS